MRSVLLLFMCAFAACQNMPDNPHVIVLHANAEVSDKDLLEVFSGLGVDKKKAEPLLERVSAKGEAIVVAGAKDTCEAAAERFTALGMRTTVRAMTEKGHAFRVFRLRRGRGGCGHAAAAG